MYRKNERYKRKFSDGVGQNGGYSSGKTNAGVFGANSGFNVEFYDAQGEWWKTIINGCSFNLC